MSESKRVSWSHVRMFETMADKIRAGDPPESVLAEHGYVPVAERDALKAALRELVESGDRIEKRAELDAKRGVLQMVGKGDVMSTPEWSAARALLAEDAPK